MTDNEFIAICKSSVSMSHACSKTGLYFSTFKRRAIKLNCYKTNQGLVGISKKHAAIFSLQDILNGKYPHFNTFKLKIRLLKSGEIENKCGVCGIEDWNDKPLNMELDHIDGNRHNHLRKNLRMICPNCHSQTPTYCSKNIIYKKIMAQ